MSCWICAPWHAPKNSAKTSCFSRWFHFLAEVKVGSSARAPWIKELWNMCFVKPSPCLCILFFQHFKHTHDVQHWILFSTQATCIVGTSDHANNDWAFVTDNERMDAATWSGKSKLIIPSHSTTIPPLQRKRLGFRTPSLAPRGNFRDFQQIGTFQNLWSTHPNCNVWPTNACKNLPACRLRGLHTSNWHT